MSRSRRPLAAAVALAAIAVAACSSGGQTPPPVGSAAPRPSPAGRTAVPVPSNAADAARAVQSDLVAVIQRIRPSVVQISTDQGLGSGIIFDSSGDIVTNDHVVSGAASFTVTDTDGKTHPATLVGAFAQGDLAVVHSDGLNLPAAGFADSSKLEVGDLVMAVGNPLGLRSSVTEGIVSATGRTESEGNGVTLSNVIQTSAAINPGNSGGALVDIDGNVVGIPTLAATDPELGGAAGGIGFAIPANTVKDIAAQLIQYHRVINTHRAYLGVQLATPLGGGVVVAQVVAGGPAAQAGLQAGDQITAINGQPVQTPDDVNTTLAAAKPGDSVQLQVTRQDGSTATLSVTLGELPG